MIDKRMGKFVTREHIAFTDEEIQMVIANIKKQISGNRYGIEYDSYNADTDGLFTLRINLKMPHYVGRDADRARFDIRGIRFILWKAKGEIEVDWNKGLYDPFDGVCYSGDILFTAQWCRYRGRTFTSYQKECPYEYGDEISDLDYTKALNHLYKDLRLCIVVD